MFFQIQAFEESLTVLMEETLKKNQINIYRKLFNFVVFCDGINNCFTRTTDIASRKDKEHGQRTLLRHFSKWLFLTVDPPLSSEVHADLDNIAIAVKEKCVSGSSTLKVSTLLWKPNGRQWSQVGNVTNNRRMYAAFVAPLFPNTKYMLNGRKLKIGIMEWEQFCMRTASSNDSIVYTHVCTDLFDSLGEYLNFTYQLIEPADQSWGELNGTWSGLLGMVARNEVDLCGIPYGINLKRSKSFAFPSILYKSECQVVHRKLSANDNHWMLLVSVFKWEVYVCGLMTMAWCIGLHTLLGRYRIGEHTEAKESAACPPSTSGHVMTAVLVTLHEGSPQLPHSRSGRILYASWWMFCVTILAVYTGNLVAIISVVKERTPFNTMGELAESEDFKVIIRKGSSFEDTYKNSNDSVSKKIWTKVLATRSANMGNALDEDRHYKMLLQSGYYALITYSVTIDGMEASINNLRRMKCGLGPIDMSLPFPLNSPLAEIFTDKLIRLYDNGVLEALSRKWYNTQREEYVPTRPEIDISTLRSVWVMCASGITVGFVILGAECFFNYCVNKN
ncbi:probable glutamate receptor [Haliotis asinina]|uniref:probable glutamate receptor n=1 Tax=Haliotis asinina TaxID=109174 RepID=UPI00353227F9